MLSKSVLIRTGLRSLSRSSSSLCAYFALNTSKSIAPLAGNAFQSANLLTNYGRNCLSGSGDASNNRRSYCSSNEIPVAEYDEIKDLQNHPEKLLIDVREADELVKYGKIPTSINIPLGIVEETLTSELAKEHFYEKFNRTFPDVNDEIIFMCQKGVRAQKASLSAKRIGFKNVKNYRGSWVDWAEREGIPIPQ